MCGRITLADLSWPEFRDWLSLAQVPDGPIGNRFNLAPTGTVPIVRAGPEGLEGTFARWWFVPEWFRGNLREWKANTLNARSEEVAGKPTFRDAFRHKRCVVLASGYYEWQERPDGKHPFHIHPADNAPALIMAGLWSEVRLPDFEGLTCAVLTEGARAPLDAIHDRMPLMIGAGAVRDWLGGCDLAALPRLGVGALGWHEVGRAVNSVRNDSPDLVLPLRD